MSYLVARTGRTRQRFSDKFRLVAGCIPYKLEMNKLEGELLVLMISSPNRNDLVFPKGGWENDETVSEAAAREALEEAGVKGTLSENPLGVWEYRSKSSESSCSKEGCCRGYIFSLRVTEELEFWPEKTNRDRKWLTVKEAIRLCRYDWMREALDRFSTTFSEDKMIRNKEEAGDLRMTTDAGAEAEAELHRLSPSFFGLSSSVQQLEEESSKKCAVQG